MSITIKTSTRDSFVGEMSTVELWINGVCFRTDVPSLAAGCSLVMLTARAMRITGEVDDREDGTTVTGEVKP
jgi:hypothetical protein